MSPSPATLGTNTQRPANSGSAPVAAVPFIRASAEHREPAGIDITRQLTASDIDLGVFDIPAYGYLRAITILVTATGGVGTGVTAAGDAPFNALKNITFSEPNGATIAQFNSGYDLYLAHKWGGYRHYADARALPGYAMPAASGGGFSFMLRIPVEISGRDGLGSLPNQNAAATFKLRMSLARLAEIYGTAPTTAPSVNVKVFIEAWDQPESQVAGRVNQITPPAVNTTQFWSAQTYNVNSGNQTIRLTRVGNYLRNLIFVYRAADGNRQNASFPDLSTLYLDTRPLDTFDKTLWQIQMTERTGYITATQNTPNALDAGVYVYDFTHEFAGKLGAENRDLWMPTLGSTRLELQGNFSAAGTLTVLTNDVAVAGEAFL